MRMMAIKIEVT